MCQENGDQPFSMGIPPVGAARLASIQVNSKLNNNWSD